MGIKILDKNVINKISAGEVVERPASIVKELVENSIDAGATNITVEIEGGGIDKISVTDNGCGINKDEVILAFTPHATSKLTKFEDLNSLATMGFRGEALATISAVSKVTLITKTEKDDAGIKCEIVSGEEISRMEVATVTGTKIEVKDVFYNTPARLKFLRKPKSEESDITNYVQKLILSHSNIAFKYIVDGKLIYNTSSSSIIDNIYSIYGKETSENVLAVDYEIAGYTITGFISKPEFCKANRTYQSLFINSRFCSNALVSSAVSNAYDNFTMKGKFPFYVLFINLPQDELDVNVHPNKLEVKFTNTQKIYKLCIDGVFKALSDYNHIRNVDEEESLPEISNVTFAEVKPSEGVSFEYNQTNEQKHRSTADYFRNNKNDGSYGFHLTDNILTADVIKKEKEKIKELNIPEEIVLNEIEVKESNTQVLNSNGYVREEVEQSSYKNIFQQDYKLIGKVFNTYLILEQEDKVYFIDQHAGHERIKYDNLISELENNTLKKQDLLFPYTFTVSSNEYNFLIENLVILNDFGIEIAEFGLNTFKISAVPLLLSEINLKEFISQLLLGTVGFAKSPKEILKEKFMQMACKSAVKGGDDLKDIEIKELLNKLKNDTKVLLCPHGRPIVVELTQKQIEKWFKRIV